MWFLKGRPTNINVKALIASISGGYQQTSYRFSVQTESNEKVWIALAVPWAPHKHNGGVVINNFNFLNLLEENSGNNEDITVLDNNDIQLWGRLRDLKIQPDIEMLHVQELITWHLDDIGIVSCWIEPGKTYQISYTHKISADSCLFLPTRLPTIIAARKPLINYKLWVVDGVTLNHPAVIIRQSVDTNLRSLLSESQHSLELFAFKDWDWSEDTRINTDNWESSDDDFSD